MIKCCWLAIILIIASLPIFAQNTQPERQERIFSSPLFETIGYSDDSIAYGGGFAIGTGSGTAFGLRLFYAVNPENFAFL